MTYRRHVVTVLAVALLGAGVADAAVSTSHATGAVQLEQLTAHARATSPDGTLVELKPGLVVSLGALRSDHRSRMQRFANAAALGTAANTLLASDRESRLKHASRHPALTLLAIPSAAYDAVPWTGVPGSRWAPDYTSFCKAAKTSICLYVPKSSNGLGSTLAPAGASFTDIDMLITDKAICSKEDGSLYARHGVTLGCLFFYPSGFNVQYFAGAPPSVTTNTKGCRSSGFSYVIDPHGGVEAYWNPSYRGLPWGGSSSKTATCTISVMVPAGQPKPAPTPVL